jgi:Rieske Fe-S protein
MTPDSTVPRRTLLLAGAGAAGAGVLAACSSGSSTAKTSSPESQSATTTATPADGSAQASTSASGTATRQPNTSTAKALVTLADIPVGQAVSVNLPGGKPGIVSRTSQTGAACFSAICTHMGCTVKPSGDKLDCPCHQSQFDAKSGQVLAGPAPAPLPKVAVKVVGGEVVLG